MPAGVRKTDPYRSFRFFVEIQGVILGGFSEVSGLTVETEFEELREGGLNEFAHKLPKWTKYPNLILKRGLIDTDVLWKWQNDVVKGIVRRKTIFVVLMDSEGNEKWRWTFGDAYPVKWIGPDFKADGSAIALESLEIAHHGFTK